MATSLGPHSTHTKQQLQARDGLLQAQKRGVQQRPVAAVVGEPQRERARELRGRHAVRLGEDAEQAAAVGALRLLRLHHVDARRARYGRFVQFRGGVALARLLGAALVRLLGAFSAEVEHGRLSEPGVALTRGNVAVWGGGSDNHTACHANARGRQATHTHNEGTRGPHTHWWKTPRTAADRPTRRR